MPKITAEFSRFRKQTNKKLFEGERADCSERTQQKVFLFGCFFFFCGFFFWGVFFLNCLVQKKKKEKKKNSEIVISIILVKLSGCVCVRVCVRVRSGHRGSSRRGLCGHPGAGGSSGPGRMVGARTLTWSGLEPAGPERERKRISILAAAPWLAPHLDPHPAF